MKKIFSFLALVILIFTLCGCKAEIDDTQNQLYFPSEQHISTVMDASVINYKNTYDMYMDSVHLVIGRVTESDKSANISEQVPIAISKVKIEKVLKGGYAVGDEINIHETGERNESDELSIDGVPLLKKDMKVLLFLNKGTDYYIGKTSHGICGVNFGKFFYDENGLIHSSLDFAGQAVTKLEDFTEPMTEDQFVYLISDAVS